MCCRGIGMPEIFADKRKADAVADRDAGEAMPKVVGAKRVRAGQLGYFANLRPEAFETPGAHGFGGVELHRLPCLLDRNIPMNNARENEIATFPPPCFAVLQDSRGF